MGRKHSIDVSASSVTYLGATFLQDPAEASCALGSIRTFQRPNHSLRDEVERNRSTNSLTFFNNRPTRTLYLPADTWLYGKQAHSLRECSVP